MKSPEHCAREIAAKALFHEKRLTRFTITLVSLSKLAKREVLDQYFLSELGSFMLKEGWCMFQSSNTHYAFIKREPVNSWTRITFK